MTIAVITAGGTDSTWRDQDEVRAGCVPVQPGLTAEDLRFAQLAVRVHCCILWPIGERCFSDGARFPCEVHIWGRLTLLAHGWTCTEIDCLGTQPGP